MRNVHAHFGTHTEIEGMSMSTHRRKVHIKPMQIKGWWCDLLKVKVLKIITLFKF